MSACGIVFALPPRELRCGEAVGHGPARALRASLPTHPFAPLAPTPPCRAVSVGDRIAQLVLERIATPEVEEVASLDDTERGAGGFGSTGVAAKQ